MIYLAFADYESLCLKGVAPDGIIKRDEGGFFDKIIHVHIAASKTQFIKLNDAHVIYEYGLDIIPGAADSRFIQYLQAPLYLLNVIIKLAKLVRRERIDLIRGVDPYWCGLIAWICSKLTGVPFCISIHADYDKCYALTGRGISITILGSRKLAKFLEHAVLSRANLVMPIRESLARMALQNGANPNKVRVIPHGIDTSPFKRPPKIDIFGRFGLQRGRKIISFVGRLVDENYVDDILLLIAKLLEKRNDFILIMAGGGPKEQIYRKRLAQNSELNNAIRLIGFQPNDIVIELRRASTVNLCLMAGFSLIESCAAGRPVVSYDVEWHYELVRNNETGFLIPEHDINGLVESVSYLLDCPDEADRMGRAAQALVLEKHDISKTSVVKHRCYEKMLLGSR